MVTLCTFSEDELRNARYRLPDYTPSGSTWGKVKMVFDSKQAKIAF